MVPIFIHIHAFTHGLCCKGGLNVSAYIYLIVSAVAELLQRCCSADAAQLQRCCSAVAVLLHQCCHAFLHICGYYVHVCKMYVHVFWQPKVLGALIHTHTVTYAHACDIQSSYANHRHIIGTAYEHIHTYFTHGLRCKVPESACI